MDLCEFEICLVYKVTSRNARAVIEINFVLKKKTKCQQTNKRIKKRKSTGIIKEF